MCVEPSACGSGPRAHCIDASHHRTHRGVGVKVSHSTGSHIILGLAHHFAQPLQRLLPPLQRIERFSKYVIGARKLARGQLGLYAGVDVGW